MTLNWMDAVQAVVAALSLPVAIWGLRYVGKQIRQVEKQIRQVERSIVGQAHQRMYTHDAEIGRLFVDHPSLRPYFYDDVAPRADDPEIQRILAVTELVADYLEHVALSRDDLPQSGQAPWRRAIEDIYEKSPILREYLDKRRSWYTPEFLALLPMKQRPPVAP